MNAKYPLELIEWYDAESHDDWEDIESVKVWAKTKSKVFEIGWIVVEDKNTVIIASQLSADGDIGNRTKIEKKWIVSRKKIKG